jgi:hypothetical protein
VFTCDSNPTSPISLSGIGILHRRSILEAPESTLSYRDAPALHQIALFQNATPPREYGFHECCWLLLRGRLGAASVENDIEISQALFRLLYASPCTSFSSFEFGHDYEGAAATHKFWGAPQAIDPSL